MERRLFSVLSFLLLPLLLAACGASSSTEAPAGKTSITLPPIEAFAEPSAAPPVVDERQIAFSEQVELEFGMRSVTDRLENGEPCRECIYASDGSLFSQTYYTYGDKALSETDTYLPDGTLSSYSVFLYEVDGAAQRQLLYDAASPQSPRTITDMDAAERVVHQWQEGPNGERTEWLCAYTDDKPQMTYSFSVEVDQDRVPQDRPGMYIQVEEFFSSRNISYEMQAADHQVIYGGHSASGGDLTSFTLIECARDGTYLLQNIFNGDGALYYRYDIETQQILFEDETLSPGF